MNILKDVILWRKFLLNSKIYGNFINLTFINQFFTKNVVINIKIIIIECVEKYKKEVLEEC